MSEFRLPHLFLVFLSLLALSAVRAADLTPAETAQLLERLQEHRVKNPSLTADFTEVKTTHLLSNPLVSQGSLSFQAPNKFRRELRGSQPSTMVSNGQKLWIFYPSFNAAELYTIGQHTFFDNAIEALTAGLNFQHVADFYRCTAAHEAEGYRLVLTPKSGDVRRILKKLTVWVDDDLKILKTQALLPKDDEVLTTYHNQHPVPVPASTFEFTPPNGAAVTQPLGK